MVTEYGMSDLGPLQFEQQDGSVFLGRDYNKAQHFSNEVANEIDIEMRKIITTCHNQATKIIKDNKDLLKLIAEALLEYETLTKEQIDYLVEHKKMPDEDENTSLEAMSITKLKELAKKKGIKNYSKMNKAELLKELDRRNAEFIRKSEIGMTAMEMVTEKGFISYILDSIKAKDKEISILSAKINKQLMVVTEASREVQTLEKLEEKQFDEYKFKERKADEAFIDEYVGNRRHYGN